MLDAQHRDTFPEYHTSADNLEFIRAEQLAQSLRVCVGALDVLEGNQKYRNLQPYGEPQLGRRDLYRSTGGESISFEINARLWVLNFSDGEHSLLDIAERSGIPFPAIRDAADLLVQNGLLSVVEDGEADGAALDDTSVADVLPRRRKLVRKAP